MGHDHSHSVAHFSWCNGEARHGCYCEVIRYTLSASWGFLFAGVQWYVATRVAGSHGAESDASHAFADSSFILISAFLALLKLADHKREGMFDDVGIWVNSSFLIGASIYILYGLVYGKGFATFSSSFMFLAGLIGLVGNAFQVFVLGDAHDHGVSMHSTTKQHIIYDMFYSGLVMISALVAMIISWLMVDDAGTMARKVDVSVAFALAGAMFFGGSKNIYRRYVKHEHAYHH